MLDSYISALCRYAERTGLLQPEDLVFARNALLEALQLDSFDEAAAPAEASLADILQVLTGDAVARGVCPDNQVARDLFDTKLMAIRMAALSLRRASPGRRPRPSLPGLRRSWRCGKRAVNTSARSAIIG